MNAESAASARLKVAFRPREEALTPRAVLAFGEAARELVRRVLAHDDATLARLRGVSGVSLVILEADDPSDLPWVDGVTYVGRDPDAPSLLLPTTRAPDVPAGLFERALLRAFPAVAPPIVVDPFRPQPFIASLASARPLERTALQRFLDGAATSASPPGVNPR